MITFHQVMSDDTCEMHDLTGALLGHPPSQPVV